MMINVPNAKKLVTWHAIALTSDALTVIIMGMLQQIALTKSHLQVHQQDTGTTTLVDMIDPHLRVIITPGITTMTIGIDTGSADLNLTPITLDIVVTVAVILAEVTLHPFTNKCHYKTPKRPSSSFHPMPQKPMDRKYKQVTIDDPPLEYYSSDELDSDSEDNLN